MQAPHFLDGMDPGVDSLGRCGCGEDVSDWRPICGSVECARVLSKLKLPATIIFLTVAGEEQGLNGSEHFARMTREQNWNIEAVLNDDIVGGNRSPEQDAAILTSKPQPKR